MGFKADFSDESSEIRMCVSLIFSISLIHGYKVLYCSCLFKTMKRSLGNSEHPEIPQSVFDVFDVKASGGVSEHLGLHVSNLGEGMTG